MTYYGADGTPERRPPYPPTGPGGNQGPGDPGPGDQPGQGGNPGPGRIYPSRNYPDPGYPAAGQNPGYPEPGYPTQGYPTQGYPTQGRPTHGYPEQARPEEGRREQGGYPDRGRPGGTYGERSYAERAYAERAYAERGNRGNTGPADRVGSGWQPGTGAGEQVGPPARRRGRATTVLLVIGIVVLLGGLGVLGGSYVLKGKDKPAATAGQSPPAPSSVGKQSGSASAAPAGADSFTFSAVGDTVVAAAPNVPPNNAKGFFDDVQSALTADLRFANLEEAVTDDTGVRKCGADSSSCHAFRAPPACAQALKDAGFGIVSMANNHANDFGSAGLKNTKATLDSLGILYTGPPGMIPTVTVKGIKVAMLGFSPYAWSNDLNDIPGAAALVKQAASQADVVIVTAHVGAEGSDKTHVKPGTEYFLGENRGDSIAFSHAVIDAGADLVVLQGPHVMRGMEFYKEKLIDYSMGNFAGYHALSTGGVLGISGVLRVTLGRDGSFKAATLVPTSMVDPGYPRMDPKKRAIAQVRSLTKADFPKTGPNIADDGTITPPAA
jgi:poly-gamma-glutamate capsule biosynthesis protein CapA/YwtB (metallophosphatase superfamily)